MTTMIHHDSIMMGINSTLYSAASMLETIIKGTHNSPPEILALFNEVNDLRLVLCRLENVDHKRPNFTPEQSRALNHTNGIVSVLQALINTISETNKASAMENVINAMLKRLQVTRNQLINTFLSNHEYSPLTPKFCHGP